MQVGAQAPGRRGSPRSRPRRCSRSRRRPARAERRPSSRYVRPAWFSKPRASAARPARARIRAGCRRSCGVRRRPVVSGKRPTPGQLRPGAIAVEASEQLVAAADGEQRRLRRPQRLLERGALGGEVVARSAPARDPGRRRCRRGRRLLGHGIAEADGRYVEADPAPGAAALEHRDVARDRRRC